MLISMTGQGQGRVRDGALEITAEVRAVNNRHLKLQTRTTYGLQSLEPKIESLVRSKIKRGSLQLNVQSHGSMAGAEYKLEEEVLAGYLKQCGDVLSRLGLAKSSIEIKDLLQLPGVVSEPKTTSEIPTQLEQSVLQAVDESLDCLSKMRIAEGKSMERELSEQLERLVALADSIEQRAPQVVEEYKKRLQAKLSKALEEVGAELQEADLVREVLVMADKADIREELVRLRSHFEQFGKLLQADMSQGRKLDFLIQELFREVNTVGSKCGDADIAQRVVDMKTIIEQMREQVQNVE
ncbi:MAG: YicC/YloC family endoribonuclease [Planctomycetota bacterium]